MVFTSHATYRCRERCIKVEDIKHTIMNGEIIEQYPKSYPNLACLVLDMAINNQFLHVVLGTDYKLLWVITTYYPEKDRWNSNFKTRKAVQQYDLFFCKGDMLEDYTSYIVDLGKCVIVIRNVPCYKCNQCGEVAYSATVVKELERMLDVLENTLTEITIVNYANKVAQER